MTHHITPPDPPDPNDPRLKGPSHDALVRAWPIIERQTAACRARLARETTAREREEAA